MVVSVRCRIYAFNLVPVTEYSKTEIMLGYGTVFLFGFEPPQALPDADLRFKLHFRNSNRMFFHVLESFFFPDFPGKSSWPSKNIPDIYSDKNHWYGIPDSSFQTHARCACRIWITWRKWLQQQEHCDINYCSFPITISIWIQSTQLDSRIFVYSDERRRMNRNGFWQRVIVYKRFQ